MKMAIHSTLGKRGHELANGPNLREKYKGILSDLFDPDTNPGGLVNLGQAENVGLYVDFENETLTEK